MIVGQELVKLLDAFDAENHQPLLIVETGCLRGKSENSEEGDGWSTLHVARWIATRPANRFISIDLDPVNLKTAREFLGSYAQYVSFLRGESVRLLDSIFNVDFAFLDTSDDPEHGLAEFKAAEEKGARMIVMDDVGVKTPLAEKYASENGWNVVIDGRLAIMRR